LARITTVAAMIGRGVCGKHRKMPTARAIRVTCLLLGLVAPRPATQSPLRSPSSGLRPVRLGPATSGCDGAAVAESTHFAWAAWSVGPRGRKHIGRVSLQGGARQVH
jgi:hypothetical protein